VSESPPPSPPGELAEVPLAEEIGTLYDKIPYDSRPYPRAHIDRLATVATLMGLTPPPITACRVLEIGCAAGGHIIPMALTLPGSTFVGIDLSARELADGHKLLADLGLKNIQLLHQGIEAVGTSLGQFDYIICHGVFSWVPQPARLGILDICRRNLVPNGVAYVSYNVYPGWHFRDLVRHMMRFHTRDGESPLARARDGRDLLEFLAKAVPADKSAYGAVLRQELDIIRRVADWYICHDHMADINVPLYFHQFVEMAAASDLQYLGEAQFSAMLPRGLPPDVAATLQQVSRDFATQQQYLDFVRATPFRHSLLCHKHVKLHRQPTPASLETLHVATQARVEPPATAPIDPRSTAPVVFTGPGGKLTSNRPLMKAAMLQLMDRWPGTIPFPELCAAAATRLDAPPVRTVQQVQADTELLGSILLKGYYTSDLLEFHCAPAPLCPRPSDRPHASPLARLQAQNRKAVTSLRHDTVELADMERHIIPHLDGAHDRPALLDALANLVRQGTLLVSQPDPAKTTAALEKALAAALTALAEKSLLVA
jgi:SAM-dependent methyltransferase